MNSKIKFRTFQWWTPDRQFLCVSVVCKCCGKYYDIPIPAEAIQRVAIPKLRKKMIEDTIVFFKNRLIEDHANKEEKE